MRFAQPCFYFQPDYLGKEDSCISYSDQPWRHLLSSQSSRFAITLLLLAKRQSSTVRFKFHTRFELFPQPLEWGGQELGGQAKAWPLSFVLLCWRTILRDPGPHNRKCQMEG
jgi:hypothetical protein